jgi:hypothetical protein
MRASLLALAVAVALVLALPRPTAAWVVVRAPVYYAPRPVYYAPPPIYYAPPPVYVAPPPVVVAPPPPRPPAPLTTKLPMNTQLSELPSGCTSVSVKGESYQVCGPNWLKGSDFGAYYVVVPAPQ